MPTAIGRLEAACRRRPSIKRRPSGSTSRKRRGEGGEKFVARDGTANCRRQKLYFFHASPIDSKTLIPPPLPFEFPRSSSSTRVSSRPITRWE